MLEFYVHNIAWFVHQAILISIYWKTHELFYPAEEPRWVYFNATETESPHANEES